MPGNKRTYNKRRNYKPKRKVSKMVSAAPKSRANLVRLIKKIQLGQTEIKYKSRQLSTSAMNHNTITKVTIWDKDAAVLPVSTLPAQGQTDATRLGDRIHAIKFKLRMTFDVPYDRRNTRMKIFYLEYNSDQGDPTDIAQFQHSITGETRLDPIQKKRWGKSLRYLGEYRPDRNQYPYFTYSAAQSPPAADNTSANTAPIVVNLEIPLNRKVFFTADGAMTPANLKENGCLLFVPYATINTTSGDNVVISSKGAITLYYKDL